MITIRDYNRDLLLSAVDGNMEGVRDALSHGANINTTDNYGHTALMFAVKNNKFEVTEYLLSKGANYKLVATDGFSAEKYVYKVEILKVRNPDSIDSSKNSSSQHESKTRNYNSDLLVYATHGDMQEVQEALKNGADINTKTRAGSTALMLALKCNEYEVADYLLYQGADYNFPGSEKYIDEYGHLKNEFLIKSMFKPITSSEGIKALKRMNLGFSKK